MKLLSLLGMVFILISVQTQAQDKTPLPTKVDVQSDALIDWKSLNIELKDEVQTYRDKQGVKFIKWKTYWLVNWKHHAEISHYEVRSRTSEGESKKAPKILQKPPYKLEVALGDNPKKQGFLVRDTQLQTISSMLSLQFVPVTIENRRAQASDWYRVGALK
jgi:hypothetical protein